MDNEELIRTLQAVPPTNLRINKLVQQVTLKDGSIDLDQAGRMLPEFEEASQEAHRYVSQTKKLGEMIRWKLNPLPQ